MHYSVIDLNTWKRGGLFKFYIEKMRIVMSLTCDIDVAPLTTGHEMQALQEAGFSCIEILARLGATCAIRAAK